MPQLTETAIDEDVTASEAMPGQARAPRRKRQELERLIVATGKSIITEEGLGSGVEHLTFKRVFDRLQAEQGIKVTNASVIGRIWENQEEFQHAVLRAVAASGEEDLSATLAMFAEIVDAADRSTPESRMLALSEICRVAGAIELDAMLDSGDWRTWVAMWGLHASKDSRQADPEVGEQLARSYDHWTEFLTAVYSNILDRLGFELVDGLTISELTAAIAAVTEGAALRDRLNPEVTRGITATASPDGEEREWTLLGLACWSIAKSMLRPVEGFTA